MYSFKQYSRLAALSVLLLVSSTPIKSEPVTIIVGGVCLAGGAIIGYLCSDSKEKLPSSRLVVDQAENLRQQAAGKHYQILHANAQKTDDGFRQELRNRFMRADEVDQQSIDLRFSLNQLDEKIEQLQKVVVAGRELTLEQKNQICNEEDALKKSRQELARAFSRFNKNKPYFSLHVQLHEIQKRKVSSNGMYPTLDKVKNIDNQCNQLNNLAQDAVRLGYQDLFDYANRNMLSKMHEQGVLREQPSFAIEHKAQLEHASKVKCQEIYNIEMERQADKDRQVRRQEIVAQKQRNALRQQELDLAEGRIDRKYEGKYRDLLSQIKNQLRQSQDSLRQTQRTLDTSLAREQGLRRQLSQKESEKEGLSTRIIALQKQLKKTQARERKLSKNYSEEQEGFRQCEIEGCSRERCPGHPEPSAPSAVEEDREGYAEGPPQAKLGATRR